MIMDSIALIILLATITYGASESTHQEWTSNDQANWVKSYPHCGENKQSPVNIVTCQAEPYCFKQLHTNGYEVKPNSCNVTNSGHSAQFNFNILWPTPSVTGGPLPEGDKYVFEQIHFHWGEPRNTEVGSEHRINGKSYSLEMHLVHYNTKYGSFANAAQKDDGEQALMVFAVLFEISQQPNMYFQPIIDGLKYVIKPSAKYDIPHPPSLGSLMPKDWHKSTYYTYNGSLTTPPCSQSVTWIIINRTVSISLEQHDEFEKLQTAKGVPLVDTFRNVQELGGRKIAVAKCNPPCTNHPDDKPNMISWPSVYSKQPLPYPGPVADLAGHNW